MRDVLQLVEARDNPNVRAFLMVIRVGEGTADVDGYRRHFGGSHFDSFAAHPRKVITAGLGKNQYTSSAAGAYQFLTKTWDGLVKRYGFTDFEPATQDIAAIALIDGRGALDDVLAGRFEAAVKKCNREWASLPGSPYGQPTKTMAQATKTYLSNGGALGSAQEAPVAPFIAAALPALIEAAPSLIRIFGKGERSEQNAKAAEVVAEIAKKSTGETTVEGAVNAIQADPEKAQAFREEVHISMNDLLAAAEKFNAMEQANIAAARQHNEGEAYFLDFGWLKLKFIHLLSLVFVGFSGWFAMRHWPELTPELKGAIITLMVIAGWNGVRDYWMGSSSGSDRKTSELLKK
jgi:muramidase (phage lysozyme)